jgi:hypothetical protein
MKLILSVSGGITGIPKESSLELSTLDKKTREELLQYFRENPAAKQESTFSECWVLDNGQETPIRKKEMPAVLEKLYTEMKKDLQYKKTD